MRTMTLWMLAASVAAVAAADEGEVEARRPVAETVHFAFHSDFEFNLYDALLRAAAARASLRPEAMHSEVAECFGDLAREERSAWNEAVDYFATNVASTWDFSRERYLFRARLADLPIEMDENDRRDLRLGLLFLEAAAPAYRACRWPARDEANRQWVAALLPLLEAHGAAIQARLERSFGKAWRAWPIPVDVVETAGWAGADTVGGPRTHIQISSRNPGYRGHGALEMIFHEASHELMGPRGGPINEELAAAAREAGKTLPRDLWHGLLFVTAGEATRASLAAAGVADYTPYAEANGVFDGRWYPLHAPLLTAWLPHLRGESDLPAAARALVAALATGGQGGG